MNPTEAHSMVKRKNKKIKQLQAKIVELEQDIIEWEACADALKTHIDYLEKTKEKL